MKKKNIIIVVVIAVILIAVTINASMLFTKNSRILDGMVKDMRSVIKDCEKVELIETKSVYGKLNGNGNGIDFFGAALVKTDSEDSVKELVGRLKDSFNIVEYTQQKGNQLESPFLVHKTLSFDHSFDMSDNSIYYAVYFVTSHEDANLLDPAGH